MKLTEVKKMLDSSTPDNPLSQGACQVIPILHNADSAILQFNGWSLVLTENGWHWEDTTGG